MCLISEINHLIIVLIFPLSQRTSSWHSQAENGFCNWHSWGDQKSVVEHHQVTKASTGTGNLLEMGQQQSAQVPTWQRCYTLNFSGNGRTEDKNRRRCSEACQNSHPGINRDSLTRFRSCRLCWSDTFGERIWPFRKKKEIRIEAQ